MKRLRPKGAAKMTAPAKRPSRKLLLAFLSMLLVAGGLVLALPDSAPTADAHPPWTETYTYEVDVTKTREVPVYKWVSLKVRVAPFTETYTYYPPCELIVLWGQAVNYCPPGETRTRPVYNYKSGKPFQVQTGTRTETYTVTETRTGTRTIHTPHDELPDPPNPNLPCGGATPCPTPTVQPTPVCAKHTHNGLASHCASQGHATAEPACTSSNGGQRVTWIAAHYNPQSKTCPAVQTKCVKPSNGHRHDSTNTCHPDHDAEPVCGTGNAGQTVTWTTHTGTDSHNHHSKVCKIEPPAGVTCPNGYEYGTGTNGWTPPRAAPAGQFWVSTRATPTWPVHECWQLRAGSCPNGQTLAHAVYSKTPNRLRVGYADLPARPTGTRWNQESANADYACYKLVEAEGFFKFVINGVVHYLKEGAKFVEGGVEYVVENGKRAIEIATGYVLSAAEQAAKVAADAAIKANNLIHSTLCTYTGALAVIAISAGKQYVAAQSAVATIATAVTAAAATKTIVVGAVVAAAIATYCEFVPDTRSDDSVPAPASGLSASAGAGEIAVSWSASATTPAAGFGYRVQWKPAADAWGGASAGSADLDHGSDLATSYTITGLAGGSAYDVRVAAFNDGGLSDWVSGQATPAKPKLKPEPSLAFDSVSCASSGSGWVISVSWSKTPESLKPDIWANEAKNRGHRGFQRAVAGTSTTFDVPSAGWYQVGMQAKIAGNKKVGDSEPVRCR